VNSRGAARDFFGVFYAFAARVGTHHFFISISGNTKAFSGSLLPFHDFFF
jgi:hypothetical protein